MVDGSTKLKKERCETAKWKPELGERYLYPCIHGCKVSYDFDTWQNRQIDKERYKAGVVCKDRESILALAVKMLDVARERVKNVE